MSGEPLAGERRFRQLVDAALPTLLQIVDEFRLDGGDVATVAGFVHGTAGPSGPGRDQAEVLLLSRERAREVAEGIAPEHAHLLEGEAPPGLFHVVALVGDRGAVVALQLPAVASA